MAQVQGYGEDREEILRPQRVLELRRHAGHASTHLYRSRSGQWVVNKRGVGTMLYWATVFFVIAVAAAVLGFTGLAEGAAGIAKVLFLIFITLFIISMLFELGRRGRRDGL
jgi:uncharacterized membrane protein YtjA (UPF0391 family)